MKKAIIYGASGLVGSYILKFLLNDSNYEQVIIVVRKDLGIRHPKLKSLTGDFSSLKSLAKNLAADEVYKPRYSAFYMIVHLDEPHNRTSKQHTPTIVVFISFSIYPINSLISFMCKFRYRGYPFTIFSNATLLPSKSV
jgi:putative NADH-flavin reductase